MVKLNTKALKPDMQIQKNVLYQINANRIVPVREEHKDCADTETVNLRYVLGDRQYAVFANEFRSPNVSKQGCKSADVLTCLIDDENKQIYTLILDIKKNISAFSDNLLKDDALLSAIHEVGDFIEQLRYAMLHKDSILLFHKDEGYMEMAEVGIATRNFEREKFLKVAEFLEGISNWQKPLNIQPYLWYKLKNNLMPYVSEAAKIRDFAECKVCVCGNFYQLQVYLLKWIKDSEYAVSVEIGLDV